MRYPHLGFVALPFLLFVSSTQADTKPSEISIGALFTLSGFGAVGGKEELQGLQLAQEEINKSGGINGKQVRLVVEDARSNFRTTTSAYKKLVTIDKVPAVVGPNWAEFSEVVAPLADTSEVPTISASGWKKGLLPKHKYFYSLLSPHKVAAKPLAEAIHKRGYKSISWVVSQNTFFMSLADATTEQLSDVKVTSRNEILPESSDFRSLLKKIQTEKPDVIVALLQENAGLGPFVRQFKDLKIPGQLIVMAITYQSNMQEILPIVDGLPSLEVIAVGTPDFRKKYFERYNEKAMGGAARSYDALMVLKSAMERCGETRAEIQKCLPTTNLRGVSGTMQFDSSRESMDETLWTKMLMVKDGKFYAIDQEFKPGEEWIF